MKKDGRNCSEVAVHLVDFYSTDVSEVFDCQTCGWFYESPDYLITDWDVAHYNQGVKLRDAE